MFLFLLHSWQIVSLIYNSWLSEKKHPALRKCTNSFWIPWFQMRNPLYFEFVFPSLSLWLFLRLFLLSWSFWKFNYNIFWHRFIWVFLFGIHLNFISSWICRCTTFANLGNFSVIMSSSTFSISLSLFSFSDYSNKTVSSLVIFP